MSAPAERRSEPIPGIRWPAVETGHHALAALAERLHDTERMPATDLEARQFEQLQALLLHAAGEVPYYRDRLRQAGFDPRAALTRDRWQRLPVLERAEVQACGAQMHCRRLPSGHGWVGEAATSGATGRPVRVLKTELSMLIWSALTLRTHAWYGWDVRGTLAAIRWFPDGVAAYPQGRNRDNWGSPVSRLYASGPSRALSITATTAEQVEWLGRVAPHYLVVFPSLLPDLVRECGAQGVRLADLRGLRTIAECIDPHLRDSCRAAWGVSLHDLYSAQEVGYIAMQCPRHDHYHAQSEGVLVEVLDEAGRACAPGEIGRVVVTPLHNFAMPLIRYAIGDYAEVGGPCDCGRTLPVLERILGRQRNLLTLPDGGRVWPRLGEMRYGDILPVTQHQMIQHDPARLELRLVAARRGTTGEEARLRDLIVTRLGRPFEIAIVYVDQIARSPGGKFEEFRSEIGGARA
jgi:phenylacetate-CoA ligase